MKPPAREQLTVFIDGEEVPGVIVYGLTSHDAWQRADFPLEVWPEGSRAEKFVLHGARWKVVCWDVAVGSWTTGDVWRSAVEATLEWLITHDCVVGWISAEGRPFCDPPSLFDPECMSGGVLAALTRSGGFLCPVDPDEPIRALTDLSMRELRAYAEGLAESSE